MISKIQLKNPKKLVSLGMMCLVIAVVWPRFLHPATHFGQDWSDGVRGILFGISIGVNLWSVRLASRQRRCDRG